MIIVKNNKTYNVSEFKYKWKLSIKIESILVDYEISKKDCLNFDDLKKYILSNENF